MPFGDTSSRMFLYDAFAFLNDVFNTDVFPTGHYDKQADIEAMKGPLGLYQDSMNHTNGQFAQDASGDQSPGSTGLQTGSSSDKAPDQLGDMNYNDAANAGQTDRDIWEEMKTYLQGLFSSTGQMQNDNRQYNAAQAAEQRKWLEYMASTNYTRAVQDMRKAGINPILAAGGSFGTSSVSGAASASSNNVTGDTIGGLLNVLLSFVGDILPSVSKVFNQNISQITSNSTSTSTNFNHNISYKK